jgi:hypothetical protein
MKYLFISSFLILLSATCKKGSDSSNSKLSGKWHLKEQRVSPGSPVVNWEPAFADIDIEFKSNEIFYSNGGMFNTYNHYDIQNDSTLILAGPAVNPITVRYRFDPPYLQLNPMCFEECSYRFVR